MENISENGDVANENASLPWNQFEQYVEMVISIANHDGCFKFL